MRLTFTAAVAFAAFVPMAAYANSGSTVSIGNANNNATAAVTGTRQLETTLTAPNNVVHAAAGIPTNSCVTVYSPPSGKAIVLTHITYDLGSGAQGSESYAALFDTSCSSVPYDYGDTVQAFEAQSHTFPTGLPMADVAVVNGGTAGGPILVTISGYLIPVTQLPPAAPAPSGWMKGMPGRR